MAELYHDVDIIERKDVTPVGKVVKYYNVSAYTKSDTYFTLRVAEKDFSKEKVDKLLTKEATKIDEIKAL